MRLALLVLAYREPEVLRRSIPLYRAAGFDIFVHLELKADAGAYLARLGDAAHSCTLIATRISIFWGGFSMVEAELALIYTAMAKDHYDRFTLVSDDTFPITSKIRLLQVLNEDLDRVMLRRLELSDPFKARYSNFFYFDHQVTSLLGRPIESAAIDDSFLERTSEIQEQRRRGKKEIDIYYGSQWWSITFETMKVILRKLKGDEHLFLSFKYSAVPDELLFQTLVGNYIERSRVHQALVYVDWSKTPRPYQFREITELQGIPPEYCFARKVTGNSAELLKLLASRFES